MVILKGLNEIGIQNINTDSEYQQHESGDSHNTNLLDKMKHFCILYFNVCSDIGLR